MALVPYRVSGAAADQRAHERLLQLPYGIVLRLQQWPAAGGAAAAAAVKAVEQQQQQQAHGALAGGGSAPPSGSTHSPPPPPPPLDALANVGLVVWEAGYLLAEYLLRAAPFGAHPADHWRSLTVIDLGTGTGLVGIALALAGARVVLTDLPHVLPLTAANVDANCGPRPQRFARVEVCAYAWGDDPGAPPRRPPSSSSSNGGGGGGAAAGSAGADQPAAVDAAAAAAAGGSSGDAARGSVQAAAVEAAAVAGGVPLSPLAGLQPDLITAADCLYHPDLHAPLLRALCVLSAPHTVCYVAYRVRRGGEAEAFAALAEGAGFAVDEVPSDQLHAEYGGSAGEERGGEDDGDGDEGGGGDGLGEEEDAVAAGGGLRHRRRRQHGAYGILRLRRREAVVGVRA